MACPRSVAYSKVRRAPKELLEAHSLSACLGAEIREQRLAARLTQRELAARLKRGAAWLGVRENRRQPLSINDLFAIAAVLEIDPVELLRRARRRMSP